MKTIISAILLFWSITAFCQNKFDTFFNYLEEKSYIQLANPDVFRNYNYEFPTGKGELYMYVRYKTPADEALTKKIIKSINKENWPKWIKNLTPENESWARTLKAVLIPHIWASHNPVYAFYPHLNKKLPKELQFEEPFFVAIGSPYSCDYISENELNNEYSHAELQPMWLVSFLKKNRSEVPFIFDFEKNIFTEIAPVKGKGEYSNSYFKAEIVDYYNALNLTKDTDYKPEYIRNNSIDDLPLDIKYCSVDNLKKLKAYSIKTELVGYRYNPELKRQELMVCDYIRLPATENMENGNPFKFLTNKDVFIRLIGYYPIDEPKMKEAVSKLPIDKTSTDTTPTYFWGASLEGKLAAIIQNYTQNYWANLSNDKDWTPTKSNLLKIVRTDYNLSIYSHDAIIKNNETGKKIYTSELSKDDLELDKALLLIKDFSWFLRDHNPFGGFKYFEKKPELSTDYEQFLSGENLKKIGVYIRDYNYYMKEFSGYNKELMNIYSTLRIRFRIGKSEKNEGKYIVQMLFIQE